jgi:prefoldin subunit 5
MVEARDIEKKSLEAHVELCAERYNALETRLESMDNKIASVCKMVSEVRDTMAKIGEKNNDRLIAWGVGLIGLFASTTIYLVTHYVLK